MKTSRLMLGLCAACLLCGAPAGAQYMYLDSNGDGLWSSADVMNANGTPTVTDVYLITNRNRDGTGASCNSGPDPLTAFSYVVNLLAFGGTVTYEAFVNRQPMGVHFGEANTGNGEYKNGYGGPAPGLAPGGPYLLCTVTIRGTSGSPGVQIVDLVSTSWDYTSFGGSCPGHDFDNTYKLAGPAGASDWTDADGLAPGTGVPENHLPVLHAPADMTVATGEIGVQTVSASDPDDDYLELDLGGAFPFLDLAVLQSVRGSISAKLSAAPKIEDIGTHQVTLLVRDGSASDEKTLTVAVTEGVNHGPWLAAVPDVAVPAGRVKRIAVHAGDADGNPLTLARPSGPGFSSVHMLAVRDGAVSGYVELAPGACEGGASGEVRIEALDGTESHMRQFSVHVPLPSALQWTDSIPTGAAVTSLAIGDLDRDVTSDLVAGHLGAVGGISILLNRGGTFAPPARYPLPGEIIDLEVEDLNGDGWVDVAAVDFTSAAAPIWLHQGHRGLWEPVLLPLVSGQAQNIDILDVSQDDLPDLIVPNGGFVSVYRGSAYGTFLPREDWPTSDRSFGLATGDVNLDGFVDVLTARYEPESVVELPGLGGGAFRGAKILATGTDPFRLASADFNWDGWLDLAMVVWDGPWARIVIGLGDGISFPTAQVIDESLVRMVHPDRVVCEDMDLDGLPDLVVSDWGTGQVTILRGGGDGTFGEPRSWSKGAMTGLAVGDLDGDGWPDVAGGSNEDVRIWWNPWKESGPSLQARAFATGTWHVVPVGVGGPNLCVRFEPVGGSYVNTEVDLTSLTLTSPETGSVTTIRCIPPKSAVEGDQDRDGIAELPACFAQSDLALLFDKIKGRVEVTASLAGSLADGSGFCAPVALTVIGTKHRPGTAVVSPNPLNPRGVLSVTTSRAGRLRVRVFDVQGRLVRTLADGRAEAGSHDLEVDGMDEAGRPLGSGIYFYVAETSDGTVRGRFAILK